METVGERGELRLLAGIGETETAADLAIAGSERGIGAELQAGIAAEPRGLELIEESRIAGRDREFEIVALGEELGEGLFAETGNDFRRRLIAGEEAFREVGAV